MADGSPRRPEPAIDGRSPESAAPWGTAIREVGVVAALVVGVVLGAAALTGVLPTELQRLVFHTPLAILVLLIGTAWILWRTATSRSRPS